MPDRLAVQADHTFCVQAAHARRASEPGRPQRQQPTRLGCGMRVPHMFMVKYMVRYITHSTIRQMKMTISGAQLGREGCSGLASLRRQLRWSAAGAVPAPCCELRSGTRMVERRFWRLSSEAPGPAAFPTPRTCHLRAKHLGNAFSSNSGERIARGAEFAGEEQPKAAT